MKQAITALNKAVEKQYTKEEIERIEWHTDIEKKEEYIWKFELPGEGRVRILTYQKKLKKVIGSRGD